MPLKAGWSHGDRTGCREADDASVTSSGLGLPFRLVLGERVLVAAQRGHVVALGVPLASRRLKCRAGVAVHAPHSNTAAPVAAVERRCGCL